LPNNKKEEVRAKNREYQRSHQARLKAKDDASKSIASSQITAQKEKARAKNYEYQQERYAALPNNKEEIRAQKREYQRGRRARLKAEANASELIASSEIIDTRKDDKGNSCKRKRVMASQEDNIGIFIWFFVLFIFNCLYCSF
jgi:hypothetical protein